MITRDRHALEACSDLLRDGRFDPFVAWVRACQADALAELLAAPVDPSAVLVAQGRAKAWDDLVRALDATEAVIAKTKEAERATRRL